MNIQRRSILDKAIRLLTEAQEIITTAADDERDYFDAMPYNLQETERGSNAEEAADNLYPIEDELVDMIDVITEAKGE